MRIEDVRAIVTGAASGIRKQLALQLARAFVAAGDLDMKGLEQLVAECDHLPGRVLTRKLDVSQEGSVTEFVGEVSEQWRASTPSSTTPASCATDFWQRAAQPT